MSKVLYTGSFDPITKGHMNIIKQASDLFDEVIIAVLQNSNKKESLFTLEERLEIIKELYLKHNNVKVVTSRGAAVDIAKKYGCKAIVRGLRSASDYDYEAGLNQINKDISSNEINTVCLFADKDYQYISSTIVKELFSLEKDISNYVDPLVAKKLYLKKGMNIYGK